MSCMSLSMLLSPSGGVALGVDGLLQPSGARRKQVSSAENTSSHMPEADGSLLAIAVLTSVTDIASPAGRIDPLRSFSPPFHRLFVIDAGLEPWSTRCRRAARLLRRSHGGGPSSTTCKLSKPTLVFRMSLLPKQPSPLSVASGG